MKRIVLATLMFAMPCIAADDLTTSVDAIFANYAAGSPGCAVGIARGGKTILERGYGMANLEYDIPITPSTIFEAGSVTKQFTAAAVLLLVQDGKLSLDDRVRKYVPELPESASQITIRQILSHTSGLRDWGTIVRLAGWRRGTRLITHAHVLDVLSRQRELNFPPGTQWSYSNSGYNLAAIIVERVSAKSFPEFTRERIFTPLGMTRSSWRDDYTRIVKGRATAYDPDGKTYSADMDIENIYGNCCLLTTVGDLLRWNENFRAATVGGKSMLEMMQTPVTLASGKKIDYGFGLFVNDGEVYHSGATAGWRAYLTRRAKDDLSIALLCNRGDAPTGTLVEKIAAAVTQNPLPAPRGESGRGPGEGLLGLYRDPNTDSVVRVVDKDNALRVTLRSGGSGPALALIEQNRYRVGRNVEIRFDHEGLHLITLHKPEALYVKVPEAAPTAAQLDEYAGSYNSDEAGASWALSVDAGKLNARISPARSTKLEPTYVDGFLSDAGDLLRFTRNPWRQVDGLDVKADLTGEGTARVERMHFVRAAVAAAENPFFKVSSLPYQAPPFDRIKDSDFQPAIEEGMKRELAEVEAIADNADAPTFANTIEALERTGDLLRRVQRVFSGLSQSNTNPTLQRVQSEEAPKLAGHRDAIYLNPKLFARVKAIYDQRVSLNLDAESRQLVERDYRDFVRAGAQLSDADKTTLRALNKEQSKLTTDYRSKVLADTNASAIVIDDKSLLDGLPEADIAAAADAAKSRGLTGKWVLTLQNTTQQPPLTYLKNQALRERLHTASSMRGNHGGENDTKAIVQRLAQLRAQRAKLLGFPTFAAFGLDEQMAKTPENALKLMTDMVPAATAKARDEAARMEKLAGFKISPRDWQYYAEQVRRAEYDVDDSQVRPYFEIDRVLRDGVFFAATRLYGITFKERKDIPVYQSDVRVFEVFDADGAALALFYLDPFSRSNKAGGAWTSGFIGQSHLLGTRPVVTNNENFTKPAAGEVALLTFGEVTTMFHEFGHALHGMFSNVKYPALAGSSVPRDFVEFPSQFNEHWALDPAVFANYAKHYKTGAPMPQALVEKLKKSRTFNQGFALTEYLAAALLDMAWHTLPPEASLQDVNAFEPEALKRFQIAVPEVPPRYHTTYFSHIWGGGYSAGYYAYLWSEVLDDDAYYWFKEHGGMTRENGQRFREMVLSRGGTLEAPVMFRAFRGRDPIVEPLLIERGLKAQMKARE